MLKIGEKKFVFICPVAVISSMYIDYKYILCPFYTSL